MKRHVMSAAAVGFGMMISSLLSANAAEIKVISSNALKTVLGELAPAFEKATEHKLVFTWGAAVPLKAQIEKGEAFDLAVLTVAGIDDLIKQGKLVGATRTNLANSGAGVAVRKGAPKPDISTVEAFKRALLNAKSVAYVEQGVTYLALHDARSGQQVRQYTGHINPIRGLAFGLRPGRGIRQPVDELAGGFVREQF